MKLHEVVRKIRTFGSAYYVSHLLHRFEELGKSVGIYRIEEDSDGYFSVTPCSEIKRPWSDQYCNLHPSYRAYVEVSQGSIKTMVGEGHYCIIELTNDNKVIVIPDDFDSDRCWNAPKNTSDNMEWDCDESGNVINLGFTHSSRMNERVSQILSEIATEDMVRIN